MGLEEVAGSLGIATSNFDESFPVQEAFFESEADMILPVKSHEVVEKIRPNMKKLAEQWDFPFPYPRSGYGKPHLDILYPY